MVYRGGSIGGDFKKADDRTQHRNDWFLVLVRESQIAGDAWIISSPGSDTVLVETLTTSGWPDELRGRGYSLREVAGGTRILPHAFHQPMQIGANGELIPVTEDSTRPVSMIIYGTGPQPTRRFEFPAPFKR
jgi:hypothetical protein